MAEIIRTKYRAFEMITTGDVFIIEGFNKSMSFMVRPNLGHDFGFSIQCIDEEGTIATKSQSNAMQCVVAEEFETTFKLLFGYEMMPTEIESQFGEWLRRNG